MENIIPIIIARQVIIFNPPTRHASGTGATDTSTTASPPRAV